MAQRRPCWSLSTKRIKLVVSYDGTDFRGWAAQTGQRTVQSTLTEAVRQATGEDVEIVGASRTDSGAHALGQVCHFDTNVDMEPEKWARVLNKVLDADLAVQSSALVGEDFNSRFCAEYRHYRYRISTGPRNPFTSRFVHDYGRAIDIEAMNDGAQVIVGEHDFLALTEELDERVENTKRVMLKATVTSPKICDMGFVIWDTSNPTSHISHLTSRSEVHIDIVGQAFLKGMMRRISGALLEIGRGHRPVDHMARLLTDERESMQWPVVLPAKGLCLMEVNYANPPRDNRTASKLA